MDEKTLRKKKNELMKAIMSDPKLSKEFRDAMNAPIGSTLRSNAKPLFSILNKVKGIRDGQGGPFDQPISTPVNQSSPNYSNMYVFPSPSPIKKDLNTRITDFMGLPEYKTPVVPKKEPKVYPNIFEGFSNIFKVPEQYKLPTRTPTPTPDYSKFNINEVGGNVWNMLQGKPITPKPVVPPVTASNMSYAPIKPVLSQALDTAVTPSNVNVPITKKAEASVVPDKVVTPPAPVVLPEKQIYDKTMDNTLFSKLLGGVTSSISTPLTLGGLSSGVTLEDFSHALVAQESGGDYTAVSPKGAMGKYQIMPFNLGYAGLSDTPENRAKFLATPALQDKAYGAMITELYKKYDGDLMKVAAAYYGGHGAVEKLGTTAADAPQGNFPSINDYVRQVFGRIPDLKLSGDFAGTNPFGGYVSSSGAQAAIDSGVSSPYSYGSDLAKSEFGGRNLTQVIIDNKEAFDKALEPLELRLSELKGMSGNFVETLTEYMAGRDEYSKVIDKMIDSAKSGLMSVDMSDKASVDEYNNNLNYLYTLKGRQNGRYSNYLKASVADYEADVATAQANYDTFYKQAGEILNQQNTLDQATYNDLMTRGAAIYTELSDAPAKALNFKILNQQYIAAGGQSVIDGIEGGVVTNPKYPADVKAAVASLSIDKGINDNATGTLDWTKIPVDGLYGIYTQNAHTGSDEKAITEGIRQVLAKTLQQNTDPKVAAKINGLITGLAAYPDPGAKAFAAELSRQLIPDAERSWSGSILSNIGDVKSAMEDLISPYGGFVGIGRKQPGMQDKARWMAKHSSLGTELLEALYTTVSNNVASGTAYAADPKVFIDQIFSGTDQENADKLARAMANSS